MALDVLACFKYHIFRACDVLVGVEYVLTDCARNDRLIRWQSVCLSSLQQRSQLVIDCAKRFQRVPRISAQILYRLVRVVIG